MSRKKINRTIHQVYQQEPLFAAMIFSEKGITADDLQKFGKSKIGKCSMKKKKLNKKAYLINSLVQHSFIAEAICVLKDKPIYKFYKGKHLLIHWKGAELNVSSLYARSCFQDFAASVKAAGRTIRASEVNADLTSLI